MLLRCWWNEGSLSIPFSAYVSQFLDIWHKVSYLLYIYMDVVSTLSILITIDM